MIVKSFKEFLQEDGIDYFVLVMPKELVPEVTLINEGQWVSSQKKDWMLRVDAENPAIKQQRHVHIARAKHIGSKNKQASWNTDGTKHDKISFNSKIASMSIVHDIAKQALGLPDDFTLEESTQTANVPILVNESMSVGMPPVLFILKMSKMWPSRDAPLPCGTKPDK